MTRSSSTSGLLVCGVVGPVLFVVAFLVEGATRPGYSPLRHPVSALSYGPTGWTQQLSFALTGALLLAFAAGLARSGTGRWTPVLMVSVGAGLVGAAVFLCDPIGGSPPGTPAVAVVRTTHGVLHDLCSTPVFTALPAACFVLGRRFARAGDRGRARACRVTGGTLLLLVVLTRVGFAQLGGLGPYGGLLQRATLVVGLGAVATLAVHLLRTGPRPHGSERAS